MSNRNLLAEIISDEFFFDSVILVVITALRNKGNVTPVEAAPVNISVIIQNVESRDLINMGLGIYADKENFSLYTDVNLDLVQKSNFITYNGKNYKVVNKAPWQGHGFFEYIITQYNGEFLSGNGGDI